MRRTNSGFTLLEVLVAMTITALALGSLYAVIAGNKRLAWRAEAALAKAVDVRSHLNYAQLTDEQGELVVDFGKDSLRLSNGEEIEAPKRKTWATAADLRRYELKDEHGDVVATGTYWIRQPLAQQSGTGQGGVGTALTDTVTGMAPGGRPPLQGPGQGRPGGFPGGPNGGPPQGRPGGFFGPDGSQLPGPGRTAPFPGTNQSTGPGAPPQGFRQ